MNCFRNMFPSSSFMSNSPLSSLFFLSTLLVMFMLSSCTTGFEPEIDESPVTVLNVLVANDSVISASVTRSWVFNTSVTSAQVALPDARVEYSLNDSRWIPMKYDESRLRYFADQVAVEGDRVHIRASSRFGEAEGWAEVPRVVPIERVEYTVESRVDNESIIVSPGDNSISHPVEVIIRYRVSFTDPADTENYYLLGLEGDRFDVDDPIISDNESSMDALINQYHYCWFFTDAGIEGKTYTLSLYSTHHVSGYYYPWNTTDTIKLISISRDYYLYLLSLQKKYSGFNGILEDMGVADPRIIFSNVNPGTGIVASQSLSLYQHDLHHIFDKIMDEMSGKSPE